MKDILPAIHRGLRSSYDEPMSRRKRRRPKATPRPVATPTKTAPPRSRRAAIAFALAAVVIAVAAGIWWMLRPGAPSPAATAPAAAAPPNAAPAPRAVVEAHFVGSEACAGCHAKAYGAWQSAHHAHAMQHATAETVLGNFAQARFRYAGTDSTFFQRDGKYFVHTDGADGKLADFEIKYTFGVDPLQQYLVEFPDGRMQALSIAWDTRPKERGGQRWFHLYPSEKVDYRDELHWTRLPQNWNFMCADCHSTDVRKNYDEAANTFHTTWKEITVGCEACHGPGSAHLEWARTEACGCGTRPHRVPHGARGRALEHQSGHRQRGAQQPPRQDTEIDVCAQCHSRRSQIADEYHAGLPFLDMYRPALLSPGLYFADGQQRDEVYI